MNKPTNTLLVTGAFDWRLKAILSYLSANITGRREIQSDLLLQIRCVTWPGSVLNNHSWAHAQNISIFIADLANPNEYEQFCQSLVDPAWLHILPPPSLTLPRVWFRGNLRVLQFISETAKKFRIHKTLVVTHQNLSKKVLKFGHNLTLLPSTLINDSNLTQPTTNHATPSRPNSTPVLCIPELLCPNAPWFEFLLIQIQRGGKVPIPTPKNAKHQYIALISVKTLCDWFSRILFKGEEECAFPQTPILVVPCEEIIQSTHHVLTTILRKDLPPVQLLPLPRLLFLLASKCMLGLQGAPSSSSPRLEWMAMVGHNLIQNVSTPVSKPGITIVHEIGDAIQQSFQTTPGSMNILSDPHV